MIYAWTINPNSLSSWWQPELSQMAGISSVLVLIGIILVLTVFNWFYEHLLLLLWRSLYVCCKNNFISHSKLVRYLNTYYTDFRASLVAQLVNNLPAMQDSWVRKILWRRKWQPTPLFLPEKSHGQRSLLRYNPKGHKELDTNEWLRIHTHTHTHTHTQVRKLVKLCQDVRRYWKFLSRGWHLKTFVYQDIFGPWRGKWILECQLASGRYLT